MNFQSKVFESAAVLAERTVALANATAARVRNRAAQISESADLKVTLEQLKAAGGEFQKIARQHGARFVKENAVIAKAAGKDLMHLGRSVYANFSRDEKPAARPARKATSTRKRVTRKAA
jgi:hypothetical protein